MGYWQKMKGPVDRSFFMILYLYTFLCRKGQKQKNPGDLKHPTQTCLLQDHPEEAWGNCQIN